MQILSVKNGVCCIATHLKQIVRKMVTVVNLLHAAQLPDFIRIIFMRESTARLKAEMSMQALFL